MVLDKNTYKCFYDHVHSYYYNLLIKWCFLPFGGEANCREDLVAPVDFSPNERILDMCCGTGGATVSILKKAGKGSQIIGMDLSSGQLRVAKKCSKLAQALKKPVRGRTPPQPNTRSANTRDVQFVQGDAEYTAFRDQSFDKVFVTHALHEMTRHARQRVLTEARRILRDNGTLIILELDRPRHPFVRLFVGFWCLYWLPFNFETPTRRDMFDNGLTKEVMEAGFRHITKTSKYRGVFQTVQGVK